MEEIIAQINEEIETLQAKSNDAINPQAVRAYVEAIRALNQVKKSLEDVKN